LAGFEVTLNGRFCVSPEAAFYFGLETFEDQFEGLHSYVSVRLDQATEEQRLILLYLSFAYHYGQQSVAASAFSRLLALPKTRRISIENALPGSLLDLVRRQSDNRWRPSHDLVAKEILRQLLAPNSADDRVWRQNLSIWASRFAEFCRGDDVVPSDEMVDLASRCFLFRDNHDPLGRESPDLHTPSHFAQLIEDIPAVEGRLTVLEKLTELFPDEAHFWGHLGRFYAMQLRDSENALNAIDRAIDLDPEDGTLYHMKGMALRSRLYQLIQDMPSGQRRTELENIVNLAAKAAEQFEIAREKHPTEEHGYISHIQMLLRVVDFARVATGTESTPRLLISPTLPPLLRESLDTAENLLDQARKLREGERPSPYVENCRIQIDALYGRFDVVLQGWNNLLTRDDVYRPPIRRQLVQAYVVRRGRRWDALEARELSRVVELLDQNLLEEPNDARNLRLWMQAVRRSQPPIALDSVIERVSYWRANSTEIEAVYYLYVLYALKALQGFALAVDPMKQCLEECRRKARLRPNRTGSLEWIGPGRGLGQLVHFSELGGWSTENDFWARSDRLERLNGTIVTISGPEAGIVELPSGVRAFFVPGKSGHLKGRDENRGVSFCLGFSYDGPRAWEVRSA
jgi:tetratricopeptide (TPR) repeat protein